MMKWKLTTFGPTPGRPEHEEVGAIGTFRFPPKPPLPRRDSYFSTIDADEWEGLTAALEGYWIQAADVLPRYYAGRTGIDPLAGESTIVPADNGWNRIVILINLTYGKLTTHLWRGARKPTVMDRVWITAKLPMIESEMMKLPEKYLKSGGRTLAQRLRRSLAESAERDRAKAALAELRRWRGFHLWAMREEDEETLNPLKTMESGSE